jgi:hypothetical protein
LWPGTHASDAEQPAGRVPPAAGANRVNEALWRELGSPPALAEIADRTHTRPSRRLSAQGRPAPSRALPLDRSENARTYRLGRPGQLNIGTHGDDSTAARPIATMAPAGKSVRSRRERYTSIMNDWQKHTMCASERCASSKSAPPFALPIGDHEETLAPRSAYAPRTWSDEL